MLKLLVLAPLLLAACSSDDAKLKPAELPSLRLTVSGKRLLDALGREVILRGVNSGTRSKFAPFIPFAFRESGLPQHAQARPFDEALDEFLDRAAGWGHNVLRLPFSWEGLEPEKGSFDSTYLDRYLAMIDGAAARNIRVIVDFHQDVFADPYCGDGFPLWTLAPPIPDRPDDCRDWFMGYFDSDEVQTAFDRFWANQDGLRDSFSDMWRHIAGQAWPKDGVIGFEIINEPAGGTAEEEAFSKDVLTPFYAELAGVIREAAPDAPVFFDAAGFSATTAETYIELPQAPGLVFAPHYYDTTGMLTGEWTGGTDLVAKLGKWQSKGDEWGLPVLLGEFGIQVSYNGGTEYLQAIYGALDKHLMHATIWEYSQDSQDWNEEGYGLVRADGTEESVTAEVIRAYPAAVAGTIVSFEYDPSDYSGRLVFEAQSQGLTEIAVPTRLYPKGVVAESSGGQAIWAHDPDAQRLLVKTEEAGTVTVSFEPA
ncbi:MAG: cellulase family glycosylhydrolase [Deltaproteobacteria bacterium]|nr:cellulase family glycosylhydrolase [Deltaproteobacteria bacterium]